ncbi:methyl-accepting chemotaxis protein [Acuticoccus sediminis]|uniref:methyl-accepting chemotaxis protein n=1 Tax=Acuticoccus sediminis TaxID=2184697 RepID=UPI001CFD350F|nr:methyl-accepting chemotaxis protein [Acuticoccus sediminis]
MQYGRQPGIVNDLGFGWMLGGFAVLAAAAPLGLVLLGSPSLPGTETGATAAIAAAQSTLLYTAAAFAVILAVVGAGVVILHGRATAALGHAIGAVAAGEAVRIPEANARDGLGRAWSALAAVARQATEGARFKAVLDSLPVPVMIADPHDDFRIHYMNKETYVELRPLENHLPFPLDRIKGQSIDVFHAGPARIRAALSDPKRMPWRSRIVLGGKENLDLNIHALTDSNGAYVATVLTWKVITNQVRSTDTFEMNVKSALEQIQSSFVDMRQQVGGIAAATASTRTMLSTGASAVSEATANVQMVASAAEELTATIAEINDRIAFSTKRAANAANETKSVARRADDLLAASERIGEVMGAISGIAYKTNLLALNATIEAASAGPAGKGFAVVAHEVKMLADQTAKATDQVSEETEAVRKLIKEVVTGVGEVTTVIDDIREAFDQVAAAVQEQQTATQSISASAHDAATGVSHAASTLSEVEALAASNLDATQVLNGRAEEIALANDNLSRNSDDLLKMMRAV